MMVLGPRSRMEARGEALAAVHPAKPDAGPSFAVAFGGGGARGLAHIHVIEALDELGIRPVAIAGSSIGAIMGAGMAAGMTGKDIHDYARSVLSRRAEVASRMWRARPGSIGEMVEGGFRVGQFNIERILKAFLPEAIPEDLRRAEDPAEGDRDRFLRPRAWRSSRAATSFGARRLGRHPRRVPPGDARRPAVDRRRHLQSGAVRPDRRCRRHRHRHRRGRRAARRRPQAADQRRAGVRRQPADDAVDHRHEAEAYAPGRCS